MFEEINQRFEVVKNVAVTNSGTENEVNVDVVITTKPEETEPVFSTWEDTQEFNKWYYHTIAKSRGKSKVELYDIPNKYKWEENEVMYKQLNRPDKVFKPNYYVNGFNISTVLCYLQVYVMLLVAVHKSVNDKMTDIVRSCQLQPQSVSSPYISRTSSFPAKSSTCSNV